jgi:hypothetical protein
MRLAWLCLALALAGCTTGPAGNQLGLCTTVCRCTIGLPSQQRACVDECLQESFFASVPNACETCVLESAPACTRIAGCFASDSVCAPLADPDIPQPGGPDAGF